MQNNNRTNILVVITWIIVSLTFGMIIGRAILLNQYADWTCQKFDNGQAEVCYRGFGHTVIDQTL